MTVVDVNGEKILITPADLLRACQAQVVKLMEHAVQ